MSIVLVQYLGAFFASGLYVFLRAFQQLNTVNKRYRFIMPTSLLMAAGDMILITLIAFNGISLIFLPIGFGGGIGAMLAMHLHGKMGLS